MAPLCVATTARSFSPSLLVLATLIALVLPQLGLCVATMTHSEDQENFDTSSSTPTLTHEYEVFVSFRGRDTHTSFTAFLFAAFDRKRIRAYRDDVDLPRGGEIGPVLLRAIETSRIAVVVFSKNYATCSQCLDELVKIMECKRLLNLSVLPIFYDVSQYVVLEQKEIFAEALQNGPIDMVNYWRTALKEAANLPGLHLEPHRLEPEFIEEIVETIWNTPYVESPTSIIPPCYQNDVPCQVPSGQSSTSVKRKIGRALILILTYYFATLILVFVVALLFLCVATRPHSEGQEYDVFVSFRGEDTRTNFTAHLSHAFDCNRIRVYKDYRDLPRGGEIESEIFNAIEKSRIAVVVLSKNYATSQWCLDELVKIMECKRRFNQTVIPVFYHVSPSVVREQKGNFVEKLPNGPIDKVKKWRTALKEVAKLAGLHLKPHSCRLETEFIGDIVKTIRKKIPPYRHLMPWL